MVRTMTVWRKLLPLLLLVAVSSLIYVSFSSSCDQLNQDNNFYRDTQQKNNIENTYSQNNKLPQAHQLTQFNDLPYEEIDCVINGDYNVGCRREGNDIYVPFSFLQRYFEIFGKIKETEGKPVFEWSHSYSMVYPPKEKYTPGGEFMSFSHYNVEVRERVKCISGVEGVPISTQWGPQGYYYPIQIAQYGLSHYSKYLSDQSRTVMMIEDCESGVTSKWIVDGDDLEIHASYEETAQSKVLNFKSSVVYSSPGVTLSFPSPTSKNLLTLALDICFLSKNGSISVLVELKGKQPQQRYTLIYDLSSTLIAVEANTITYGIGERTKWTRLTRDLATDFQKGIAVKFGKNNKPKLSLYRVLSLTLHGNGMLDNVTLATNAHLAQFYYAANWLVIHQDDQGGWPIMVTRKLASGLLEMPPGWYSAMAQGQAMSLLVRAYLRTQNSKYLDAALRATHIFDVTSKDGGVLAKFAGKYNWYEEYPTTPSVFVLNGFIYSLIGLYDLKTVIKEELDVSEDSNAERLYKTGMISLKKLLPLFDTGSGTIYDLRHFALGSAPNLARWDYHTTHINQLLLLATIEESNDKLFEETAKRWIGYMKGQRAPHN